MKAAVSFFLLASLITSCTLNNLPSEVETALSQAGRNRYELLKVLRHYEVGTEEYEAACFLISNMPGLYFNDGPAIDQYRKRMMALISDSQMKDSVVRYSKMYQAEIEKALPDGVRNIADIRSVDSRFLIENIDGALAAWRSSLWKDEVSFDIFCRYILPYRVGTEQLVGHWRDSLRAVYSGYVEGVTDLKEAYGRLMKVLTAETTFSATTKYPYSLDVLAIRNLRFSICEQSCVVIADALRSVGIPAAFDGVPRWANYSTTGHHWISLPVSEDRTFAFCETDSTVRERWWVDSSHFGALAVPDEETFPHHLDSLKIPFKVYRSGFQFAARKLDVSSHYGLDDEVILHPGDSCSSLTLQTFRTGNDWTHAAEGELTDDGWVFRNLGTPVLYLPVELGGVAPGTSAMYPFILRKGGAVEELIPSGKTISVRLLRKYPMTTYWTNRWSQMRGGVFEASNDSVFLDREVLDSIARIPVNYNECNLSGVRKYRYIRFVYPEGAKLKIEKFTVYGSSGTLDGAVIGRDFDYKPVTYATNHNIRYVSPPKGELWTGYDFGEAVEIAGFSYEFKNDDNFIVPGEEYELFWWDGAWLSLGRKTADRRWLDYDNVPEGALLLLRDHTKGKEERPFIYRDGKQVFW